MPELKGTVRCVRVGDDFGFTTVTEQVTNIDELFILWWAGLSTPADPPVHVRIVQSDWVSLLRQAMASAIPVNITHGTNSSVVLNVQLGL
jgi:hypothetical protein